MKLEEKLKRIIYWWRRYEGRRCNFKVGNQIYDKVWRGIDLDLLERRIIEFLKYPKKFNFSKPDMEVF